MFHHGDRSYRGSILITQCLQRDFLDPEPPSPNRLNIGKRMIRRMRGNLAAGEDRVSEVLRPFYQADGAESVHLIHIRDWHNAMDPAQRMELDYFGDHCLEDTPGAEFVGDLQELAFQGDIQPIDSCSLNDFVETPLLETIETILAGSDPAEWRVGVFGVYTGIKVFYDVYELRTRLGFSEVGVLGNLCGDSNLTRHHIMLDHMGSILQARVFNTGDAQRLPGVIGEFQRWMGLAA